MEGNKSTILNTTLEPWTASFQVERHSTVLYVQIASGETTYLSVPIL